MPVRRVYGKTDVLMNTDNEFQWSTEQWALLLQEVLGVPGVWGPGGKGRG